MAEEQYQDSGYGNQFFSEVNVRIRDLEERQRLLKDRILIIGESLIDERTKTFSEMQDMKKTILTLKQENSRMKEVLQRITEKLPSLARKEDFDIVKRQLDIIRG